MTDQELLELGARRLARFTKPCLSALVSAELMATNSERFIKAMHNLTVENNKLNLKEAADAYDALTKSIKEFRSRAAKMKE